MNKYSVLCEQNVNLSTLAFRVLRFLKCIYYYIPSFEFYSPFLLSALCLTRTRTANAIATAAIAAEVYTIAAL